MTLADDLKPLARSIRGIPGEMGLRPHRVFLSVQTWEGTHLGDGASAVDEEEILEGSPSSPQPPKVRQLSDEQLALGNLPSGALEIGPITTPHGGIGITLDQFKGLDLASSEALRLRVSGPLGDFYYRIQRLTLDRAIHWTIVAAPLSGVS